MDVSNGSVEGRKMRIEYKQYSEDTEIVVVENVDTLVIIYDDLPEKYQFKWRDAIKFSDEINAVFLDNEKNIEVRIDKRDVEDICQQ
jgi:hypothetical protein